MHARINLSIQQGGLIFASSQWEDFDLSLLLASREVSHSFQPKGGFQLAAGLSNAIQANKET
jgi:hypothetical protein